MADGLPALGKPSTLTRNVSIGDMVNRKILILTDADDIHAISVAAALSMRGVETMLWPTADFPTRAEETLHFDQRLQSSFRVDGMGFSLLDPVFDTVWRRRPAYLLDASLLHPADRAFAEYECSIFRNSLMDLLAPNAFWVNPPANAARAGSKMLQHRAAAEVGLHMPETLYTNSPREVRAFLKRKSGNVVYKPFLGTGWSDGSRQFLPYTAILKEEVLIDESLRLTPGIFQELVPKAYEIRLTMIGSRGFAAKVLSQETSTGRLDWRRSYKELRFERVEIPGHIEDLCKALLDELGIVFGCFDFIVTPEEEYVFLEVNEMGQFLFIERACGIPILDAFASFLSQATVDFQWAEEEAQIRYSDPEFERLTLEKAEAFANLHVTVPGRIVDEPQEGT